MGDRKFTLLEFHLHSDDGGIQFGPRAMGTEEADESEFETSTESSSATDSSSGGSRIAPVIGVIAFFAVAGYVVRRLRSVADVDDEGGEAIEVEV